MNASTNGGNLAHLRAMCYKNPRLQAIFLRLAAGVTARRRCSRCPGRRPDAGPGRARALPWRPTHRPDQPSRRQLSAMGDARILAVLPGFSYNITQRLPSFEPAMAVVIRVAGVRDAAIITGHSFDDFLHGHRSTGRSGALAQIINHSLRPGLHSQAVLLSPGGCRAPMWGGHVMAAIANRLLTESAAVKSRVVAAEVRPCHHPRPRQPSTRRDAIGAGHVWTGVDRSSSGPARSPSRMVPPAGAGPRSHPGHGGPRDPAG